MGTCSSLNLRSPPEAVILSEALSSGVEGPAFLPSNSIDESGKHHNVTSQNTQCCAEAKKLRRLSR